MKPRASVLWFPGTNCHNEMMRAFELAGAAPTLVLLNQLLYGKVRLSDTDLIGIPGGFSFGDHFGSGRVAAFELTRRFSDELKEIKMRHIPVLGICNGFQELVEAGLLPGDGLIAMPTAALDTNLSNRFEHWTTTTVAFHQPPGMKCVWIDGLNRVSMTLPVAHGQGRPVGSGQQNWNIIVTYGTAEGVATYPESPNGSAIAGLCEPTGLIAGMMPHPERRIDEIRGGTQGLAIYRAGVKAVR